MRELTDLKANVKFYHSGLILNAEMACGAEHSSQPSFQIFCRFREGHSASAYELHILGRFPSQLKGLFLTPKPLLQAGARPEEVARIARAGHGHAGFGTQP